jgi:ribosomal protein S25
MTGKVILFFQVRPDGLLSRSDSIGKVLLRNEELAHFVSEYRGNRLTVNGISMSMSKLARVLGAGKERFAIAIDVEVPGEEDIRYDVARNKVVGSGILAVRRELRWAIIKGLRSLNVLDRLDEETRLAIEVPKRPVITSAEHSPSVAPEVLAAVRDLIPSAQWPVGMHQLIANELGIPPSIAYRAISALLASGEIRKSYSTTPGSV